MTAINTNVSGIGGFDPNFQINQAQAGAGNTSGIQNVPRASNVFAPQPASTEVAKPMDLNSELANIQALRASTPQAGAGISQSLGTVAGGAAGAIFGGPAGATIGSSAGGAIGSIVDNMLNSRANDRARKKELDARRKELARQQMIQKESNRRETLVRQQGIASGIRGQRLTEADIIRNERENSLGKLLTQINNKATFDQSLKNKFLASRF